MDLGAWVSYDEQIVKSTARAMFALLRFNPQKPIKHGEVALQNVLADICVCSARFSARK